MGEQKWKITHFCRLIVSRISYDFLFGNGYLFAAVVHRVIQAFYFPTFVSLLGSASSLSYREFIECRYIGLFRISKSISYRTSHIEYLDMPSICLYFVFFRRKFSEKSENSLEIPKILRKFRKFSENSENSQKFLKIRRKF